MNGAMLLGGRIEIILRLNPILLCADSILNPEVPLALRLSGQLLLGVVNIYKKKVLYLFEDCNDAISKMQQVRLPTTAKCAVLRSDCSPLLRRHQACCSL